MRSQRMQANADNSGGSEMSHAHGNEEASRLLSGDLGFDWDTYIQQALQPITARLHEELPRLIQPKVEQMQSTLAHVQNELVAPVKETLALHVEHMLAALRAEPGAPVERHTITSTARAKSAPRATARAKSPPKAAGRTPAQPPPGPARRRPPAGKPPPGPGRRRPPPGSTPE